MHSLTGVHAVMHALQSGSRGHIMISDHHRLLPDIKGFVHKGQCTIEYISMVELKKRKARQGIIFYTTSIPHVIVPNLSTWLSDKLHEPLCVLLLDHIHDPQNLGAIFRSSALFSINIILLPNKRTAPENDVAARSASGALSIVPRCYNMNLANAIEVLKKHKIWVYSLHMEGDAIHTYTLPQRCAFIMGSEDRGISKLLLKKSDGILSIPTNNILDSLNVSTSAAIACYEYCRQHSTV